MLLRICLVLMTVMIVSGCASKPVVVEERIDDVPAPAFVPRVEDRYMAAAKAGGDYLLGMIKPDGSYVYEYDPIMDRPALGYNFLRHAGTTYSLWELYEATHDPAIPRKLDGPMQYMIRNAKPAPITGLDAAAMVDEEGEAKLGGNGLALLALAKHAQVTGSRQNLPLMRRLARWILHYQNPDGEFTAHQMKWATQEITDMKSLYYPGEAIFGLVRLYEIDPDPKWIDAAFRAAGWLVASQTDRQIRLDDLPHDHWLLYALNALHRHRPDERWLRHSHLLCASIISTQHGQQIATKNWTGGWYIPPRSTPASTRVEGLLAAYTLFRDFGGAEFAQECLKSARLGTDFFLLMQYDAPRSLFDLVHAKNPTRAKGGIAGSLSDPNVRIDYVQHAISALLALNQAEAMLKN